MPKIPSHGLPHRIFASLLQRSIFMPYSRRLKIHSSLMAARCATVSMRGNSLCIRAVTAAALPQLG